MNTEKFTALIKEADEIIIIGHKNPDFDSVGAAVGLFSIAKKFDKKCCMLLSETSDTASKLINKLKSNEEFEFMFLNYKNFCFPENKNVLVIVADTCRMALVENTSILEKASKIAVIDHHNKSSDFIKDADYIYHNLDSSSASEMVVEIIRDMDCGIKLSPLAAEALLSGIIVDTKNFCFKTTDKTFLAAAYLKQMGAESINVKNLFREDLKKFKERYLILNNSEIFCDIILMSKCPEGFENPLLVAAQSADDFLNVSGVEASFVVCKVVDTIYVCGRSLGKINVLSILEKIGGGGNVEISGAQIESSTTDKVYAELKEIIKEYLKEVF
ncbi:MAG: DHH family phosphoesterase [Lachnospiraceae bacterium]|nr:DHH family phosphoesterase [Lachnospiraceae bacterium]